MRTFKVVFGYSGSSGGSPGDFCTATAVLLTVIVLLTEARPYSCVEVVGTADTEVLNQILI